MAIFGRGHKHFTPKVLSPAGASLDAWRKASEQLDFERNTVGQIVDPFERYIAESARRKTGAPRRPSEARGYYPVTELIPGWQLVECDTCHAHAPLAVMREVIQWQDTTLRHPERVWYACSLGCSQFLQRTLKAAAEPAMAQRSRSTIPLIDRGRA